MDKAQYARLLRGEGKQYKNTNLYVLYIHTLYFNLNLQSSSNNELISSSM